MDNSIRANDTVPANNSPGELGIGYRKGALCKVTLVHGGEVTEIAPNYELLWVIDYLTGSRCLLDVTEFVIVCKTASESTPAEPAAI